MVKFERKLPIVQNQSVKWLANGYEAINNPDLVKKVMFKNILNLLISNATLGFPTLFNWKK